MPRQDSRASRNIKWIETFCVVPNTPAQRDIVRQLYDATEAVPVTGPLAAYLALLHVCGPEALQKEFRPELSADLFTAWGATGPRLKEVLRREGGQIVCPQLGTRYPTAA